MNKRIKKKIQKCKMTKSDLKHGMIVRTHGDRWGMVIKSDATDEDCIKFFYDDRTVHNHGFLDVPEVLPLSQVNEDLTVGREWDEDAQCSLYYYSIDYVYSLNNLFARPYWDVDRQKDVRRSKCDKYIKWGRQ